MLVLGIDPGTQNVGYGLIQIDAGEYRGEDFGFFNVNVKQSFPQRLKQIYEYNINLIKKTQPDVIAVEEVFVSCNAKTTLRLGHARGVIVLAAVNLDIPVAEYAPKEVKQAVVGQGNASKSQVQWMMRQMLSIQDKVSSDAADALAVALCHGLRNTGFAAALRNIRT